MARRIGRRVAAKTERYTTATESVLAPGQQPSAWALMLRAHLARRLMTQEQLAERLEVAQTTVSGWLRGVRRPPLDIVPGIAQALRLTPAESDAFSFLACESYTPRMIWERLVDLEAELASLRGIADAVADQAALASDAAAALAGEGPEGAEAGPQAES